MDLKMTYGFPNPISRMPLIFYKSITDDKITKNQPTDQDQGTNEPHDDLLDWDMSGMPRDGQCSKRGGDVSPPRLHPDGLDPTGPMPPRAGPIGAQGNLKQLPRRQPDLESDLGRSGNWIS